MPAATLTTGIAALLLLAAWHDLATRLIPNLIPIGIAGLSVLLRLPAGPMGMLASLLAAVLLFAALAVLALRGWLGGGDVKLAAALAIALPPGAIADFILATTLCGGVLALPYIAVPRLGPVRAAPAGRAGARAGLLPRIARVEARRLRQGGPLPYALAIAAGGIATLVNGSG
jgi:prepilin peptidase CpaA